MAVPPPPPILPQSPQIPTEFKTYTKKENENQELEIGVNEVRSKLKCLPAWRSEQLSEDSTLWMSLYNAVPSVLQDGPQCGIVALCMASHLLHQRPLTPEIVFNTAKSNGITTYGEMFSVHNMCKLADILLDCEAIALTNGLNDCENIITHLDKGWPVLVPYDKDESNGPCCRGGIKAHWSVLSGYLVQDVPKCFVSSFQEDEEISNLYHKPKRVLDKKLPLHICQNLTCLYVFGKQGKSKHLGIWSYQDLLRSNSNLLDWHAGKNHIDENKMVFPFGGIKHGLCNQIVMLKPKS